MKKIALLLAITALSIAPQSQAQSWLDSLKSMVGLSEEKAATPNISDMVSSVSDPLGVTQAQANGGLGSLFNYVKNHISSEQFKQLSAALPGVEALLNAAPDISTMSSEAGLSGLMDKAANYNESLNAINNVRKQFESLGLEPEMIMQFATKAKAYLDTEEGKQAQALLSKGLGKLLS